MVHFLESIAGKNQLFQQTKQNNGPEFIIKDGHKWVCKMVRNLIFVGQGTNGQYHPSKFQQQLPKTMF